MRNPPLINSPILLSSNRFSVTTNIGEAQVRLDCQPAAVNIEDGAGNVGCSIGGEIDRRANNILRGAQMSERNPAEHRFKAFGVSPQAFGEIGVDVTWRDRIDAYPECRPFRGEDARELVDGAFRGAI